MVDLANETSTCQSFLAQVRRGRRNELTIVDGFFRSFWVALHNSSTQTVGTLYSITTHWRKNAVSFMTVLIPHVVIKLSLIKKCYMLFLTREQVHRRYTARQSERDRPYTWTSVHKLNETPA